MQLVNFQICSRNLERVRESKSEMAQLTARVQKVEQTPLMTCICWNLFIDLLPCMILKLRDELGQLLHEDGDMAELYLSRKLASATVPGDENDVDEVEMLLEVNSWTIFSSSSIELW